MTQEELRFALRTLAHKASASGRLGETADTPAPSHWRKANYIAEEIAAACAEKEARIALQQQWLHLKAALIEKHQKRIAELEAEVANSRPIHGHHDVDDLYEGLT